MGDPGLVVAFLVGCLVGAFLPFAGFGLVLAAREYRQAWREGTPIEGEAMERARRRGEL